MKKKRERDGLYSKIRFHLVGFKKKHENLICSAPKQMTKLGIKLLVQLVNTEV